MSRVCNNEIYTWKKVREHPEYFKAIFPSEKNNVLIFICDKSELCTYTNSVCNAVNDVRLKAADTASDSGYVEVIWT